MDDIDKFIQYKEKLENIDLSKVDKNMIRHMIKVESIVLENEYYKRCYAMKEEYKNFLKNKE